MVAASRAEEAVGQKPLLVEPVRQLTEESSDGDVGVAVFEGFLGQSEPRRGERHLDARCRVPELTGQRADDEALYKGGGRDAKEPHQLRGVERAAGQDVLLQTSEDFGD